MRKGIFLVSTASSTITQFSSITTAKEPLIVKPCLSETHTIKELLDRHPYLLQTFLDLGLLCVGCAAEAFHTLADVAGAYGIDQDQLVARLQAAIDDAVTTGEAKSVNVHDWKREIGISNFRERVPTSLSLYKKSWKIPNGLKDTR